MKQQNTYFKANTLADPFERQISSWLVRQISMGKESLLVLFVNGWANVDFRARMRVTFCELTVTVCYYYSL